MKIEKLPSGSYRVRKMHKGRSYSLTFDSRPTKAQIDAELQARIQLRDPLAGVLSFRDAVGFYCLQKSEVLSPKTLYEYQKYIKSFPEWFCALNIYDIGQVEVNQLVNYMTTKNAPKTVKNKYGLVSSVLKTYRPELVLRTSLPQNKKTKIYIPADADVRMVLEELQGTMFYVPLVLACFGMRRSEVLALRPEDLQKTDYGYIAHIYKASVQASRDDWVLKDTKTTESERDVPIPSEIAELILQQGYVYNGAPNSITCKLAKVEEKLGISHFSMHKLRHYFASKMLTITDSQTTQALGGWKTDAVLKSVYAHALEDEKEKAKRAAVDLLRAGILS